MSDLIRQYVMRALREEAGSYAAEVDDDALRLPSLDVTLSLQAVDRRSGSGVTNAEIVAVHPKLAAPIRFMCVGFGDDIAAASRIAASQWFEVVFPVLHSLFADHRTQNVSIGRISAVNENGQRFGWRVHVGPVRVVFVGPPPSARPDDGQFLHALRHEITGVSARRTPFWIDAFTARQADGSVQSDCRLLNEYWAPATERLRSAAPELLPATSGFVSHRQFLFFEPTAPEGVGTLAAPRRRWWTRLFRLRRTTAFRGGTVRAHSRRGTLSASSTGGIGGCQVPPRLTTQAVY